MDKKDNVVMDQVKKQRTAAPKADVKKILSKMAKSYGVTEDQIYAKLADSVNNNPNLRVIRANNSLFIYFNKGNGNVEIVLETIDTPRDLIDSLGQFIKSMAKIGFKTGEFLVSNPQIIKALKMAGGNVEVKSGNTLMPDGKTPAMVGILRFV